MKYFNKIITLTILTLVFASLCISNAFAQSSVKVTTTNATSIGENIEVVIDTIDCDSLSGGTLFLTYDNTKLNPISVTAGDLGDCMYTSKLDYADNKCSFVFAGTEGTTSVNNLVTITFQATDTGKAYITLDNNSIISDVDLDSVRYDLLGDKVAYIGVTVGDIDKSGILTAFDASAVLQYTLDPTFDKIGKYDFTIADYDKDGLESANDASSILQAVLGLS